MPRVLLVDDEATFLQATADLLRAQGFTCDTAPDAASAALLLATAPPVDVVVADIRMPGNADLEFVRALDRASDGPPPPVILITGYPSLQTAIDAVGLPVVAYLVKPFAFEELLREVRRAVDRGATRRALAQARQRLDRWRDDLADLERGAEQADETFVTLTLRNVAASLVDLKRVVDGRGGDAGDPCQVLNCPRGLALGEALHEAVEVLDRTRQAFKSKELGDLRRKLEQLLRPVPR